MTDAYFHYTPSQIMLAALSLADQDLAERVIHETFHPAPPAAAQPQPRDNNRKAVAAAAAEDRARLLGVEMRDRVLEVVKSCREMLSQEPPERLKAYWETPELEQTTKLLNRKLKKCRDPDRWDLVALQKARREEGLRTEDDDDDGGGGLGTVGSDAVVFADADKRDAKRRKVNKGPQDPFGGPL
jgi:cyclin H